MRFSMNTSGIKHIIYDSFIQKSPSEINYNWKDYLVLSVQSDYWTGSILPERTTLIDREASSIEQ